MALFFNYEVDQPAQPADSLAVAWCQVEAILAVASSNNKVLFYQSEGKLLPDTNVSKDNTIATALAWKPKSKILAIGWEDNTMDVGIREKLCENELRFTDSVVIETPTAFPINPKLASGCELTKPVLLPSLFIFHLSPTYCFPPFPTSFLLDVRG